MNSEGYCFHCVVTSMVKVVLCCYGIVTSICYDFSPRIYLIRVLSASFLKALVPGFFVYHYKVISGALYTLGGAEGFISIQLKAYNGSIEVLKKGFFT